MTLSRWCEKKMENLFLSIRFVFVCVSHHIFPSVCVERERREVQKRVRGRLSDTFRRDKSLLKREGERGFLFRLVHVKALFLSVPSFFSLLVVVFFIIHTQKRVPSVLPTR